MATAVPHMKDKGVSQVYCGYDASVGVAVNEDGDIFVWGDVKHQVADPKIQARIRSNTINFSNAEKDHVISDTADRSLEQTFRYVTDAEIVLKETFEDLKTCNYNLVTTRKSFWHGGSIL